MLEFYDFTIYGFFSVYFAEQFFPSHDKFVSILISYTVFVMGYIARPVGGILFSHFGDEIGRKLVMIITMLIMGGASIGIGVLPTYEKIGIFAPILLLLLRLCQGLAVGGEIPSAVVFVTESMPGKSAFAIGCVMDGVGGGLIVGTLVNAILSNSLSTNDLYNFGWRIPFIIGGVLCIISYIIRRQLHETHVFENTNTKFPLLYLIKNKPQLILIGVGIGSIAGASTMLILIFMPTYLISIVKSKIQIANILLIANIIMTITTYIIGIVANKFRHELVMKISLVWAIFISCIAYYLIGNNTYVFISVILLSTLPGIFATMSPLLMSRIFPKDVRLTGLALSYNLGHTIFGGLAPIIVTGLIENTGLVSVMPAAYIVIVCILALIATSLSVKFYDLNKKV